MRASGWAAKMLFKFAATAKVARSREARAYRTLHSLLLALCSLIQMLLSLSLAEIKRAARY